MHFFKFCNDLCNNSLHFGAMLCVLQLWEYIYDTCDEADLMILVEFSDE